MTERLQIWAMTDGRAGNVAQAMGLAEAIGRALPVELTEKRATLKPWAAQIPPAFAWRMGIRARGWPFSGLAEASDPVTEPWPDLVIGAGRRVAVMVAALRKLHGIKAVQLLDPQMPARAFDAVVVPRHDALTGGNVLISTGALNRLTPSTIAGTAAPWERVFSALPSPRLAVLVGGPSGSNKFGAEDCARLIETLTGLAKTHGLIVTPSRRTPPQLIEALNGLGPRAWVWRPDSDAPWHAENPYPGLLGHADAVLVTEDSVNMASEAATTGLPVHILPVTGTAPKIGRFHTALSEAGIARQFAGGIETWSYQPLAEADRIAAELIGRGIAGHRTAADPAAG